jgi:hypothetical protein
MADKIADRLIGDKLISNNKIVNVRGSHFGKVFYSLALTNNPF